MIFVCTLTAAKNVPVSRVFCKQQDADQWVRDLAKIGVKTEVEDR